MAREVENQRLREAVAEADGVLDELTTERRNAKAGWERNALTLELVMLHNQAFGKVLDALPALEGLDWWEERVFDEAARGRAVFRAWQCTQTIVASPLAYRGLSEHWNEIVRLVLDD